MFEKIIDDLFDQLAALYAARAVGQGSEIDRRIDAVSKLIHTVSIALQRGESKRKSVSLRKCLN